MNPEPRTPNPGEIVISICDESGVMVQPWADAGWLCYIVDLQHEDGMHREGNIVRVGADLMRWLPPRGRVRIGFGFPPCTDLAVSGAQYFRDKGLAALAQSLQLVNRTREILEWCDCPWMIENPVGSLSSYWRKPDYTFDPCDYGGYLNPPGDAYTKKTCLWTGGGFLMPKPRRIPPVISSSQGSWLMNLGGKSEKTKRLRSKTPAGFARAVFEANHATTPIKELLDV
jgi:hypothetical protein